MPLRRTFRSPALQRRFESLGYVVIDAFSPSDVASVRSAVEQLYEGERRGFHSSMESRDHDYRARIQALLEPWYRTFIDEFFDDHVVITTAVLIKWPGDDSAMGPHQDWSFVDESQFRTLNLWLALDDVSAENGALAVLPGSQSHLVHPRSSPHLPPSYEDPTRGLSIEDLDPLYARAGQVVATDHGLLHASPPNRGTSPRVAVAAAVVPAEAALIHHFCHSDGTVEQFSVPDRSWFQTFDFGSTPTGVASQGSVPFEGSTADPTKLRAESRHPTFLEPQIETDFRRLGYAVIDLLDPEELAAIEAAYDGLDHDHVEDPGFAAGFHTTLYDPRPAYRRQVLDAIDSTLGVALERHLVDHTVFLGNFMVKQPDGEALAPHVDWTFLDESRHTSVTVWCALADTGPDAGTLGVVAGSHHQVDFVRPVNHREPDRHAATAEGALGEVVLPLRAGQAVVTDNRTLHYSLPNRTPLARVIAACVAAPRAAALHHYWVDPDGTLLRLEVSRDFYCTYALGEDPRSALDVQQVVAVEDTLIG